MNRNAQRREVGAGLPSSPLSAPAQRPDPLELPSLPALQAWLRQRQSLVDELTQALREGFQAVARFEPNAYLDCIERQEELSQRIAALDRRLPPSEGPRPQLQQAAAALRQMNAELQQLAAVQTALIEHGSRSVRCFQQVWAMNAPSYAAPAEVRPPARKLPAATESRARGDRPQEK